MSKVYVILEKNWEYNDEGFDARGNGKPSKAYRDLETADKECLRLNVEKMKRLSKDDYYGGLGAYSMEGAYGLFRGRGLNILQECGVDTSGWEIDIQPVIKAGRLEELAECLDDGFYEVYEVELT